MQPTLQIDQIDATPTSRNSIRAEDGRQLSHWSVLCEGVLIPLGFLFATLLCMVAVMVTAK
jgi:hypothetical protein